MATRQRRNLKLTEECSDYVDQIMEDNNFQYPFQAIEKIVLEHKEMKEKEWNLEYVSRVFGETMHDFFKDELSRIRMAANHADKVSQINLEVLNTMMLSQRELKGLDVCYVTDKDNGLFQAPTIKYAKEAVEERISTKRQKRIDSQKSIN